MPKAFSIVLFSLLISCSKPVTISSTRILSPETNTNFKDAGWETEYWSKQENYSDSTFKDTDARVLVISHDSLQTGRIFKKINVKPYARYKVTGFIKTENVSKEMLLRKLNK